MQRKPNTVCAVCQKGIYRRPAQIKAGGVFCSSRCCGINQQVLKKCPVCKTTYIGNRRTCSRTCANTARTGISYTKENKFNKAYQGAKNKELLAQSKGGTCERCSEKNYAILQVHHKVERHKGGSDKISNLELLCPNCHAAHHLGNSLYSEKKVL